MKYFSSQPLVSVIIPTYNREKLLAKAIESVIKQTYTNIQLIVVDDGSIDGTGQLVKSYPQVQYIFQEHAGQGRARNTGLAYAKGGYLASLDSDDAWVPDFLENCIPKLEEDNLDFVFCNWLQIVNESHGFDFFERSKLLNPYIKNIDDNWISLNHKQLRALYVKACPSPSSSLVIRRSSIKTGWDEQLNIADDWCLLLDIIFSNNCKAAFTLQRLWIKQTDGKNIYDGRNYFEVLELLYIKDFEKIISMRCDKFTKTELKYLKRRIATNIYRYALNRFFNRINISQSIIMFKRALRTAPMLLFVVLYNMGNKKISKGVAKLLKRQGEMQAELIPYPDFTRQ